MRSVVVASLLFLSFACASTSSVVQSPRAADRPMMASMQPIAPESPRAEATAEFDDSAGGLLEKGFHHFNRDEHAEATRAFAQAIGTNNLNDAGRALAYWHVYLSEKRLSREDKSAEALYSFTIVAQDILDMRSETKYAVTESGDFVERFNLPARLARARALLSVTWALRSPDFGRSAQMAVPVFDDVELDYFLELAPPCAGAYDRQIDREVLRVDEGSSLEHVTLFCAGQASGVDYFIERIASLGP